MDAWIIEKHKCRHQVLPIAYYWLYFGAQNFCLLLDAGAYRSCGLVVIVRSTATGARVGSIVDVYVRQGSRSIVSPPFWRFKKKQLDIKLVILIGDFTGLLTLPSQCNTVHFDNCSQLQHHQHGNERCFSV
jgi:hypothetical protein